MLPIGRLILFPERSSVVRRSLLWGRRLGRGVHSRRRDGVIPVRELVVTGRRHGRDVRVRNLAITSRCVLSAVAADRDLTVPRFVGVVAIKGVGVGGAHHLDGALVLIMA